MSFKCVDDGAPVYNVQYEQDKWVRYWDDMSGKELRADLVEEGRAEEIGDLEQQTGARIILESGKDWSPECWAIRYR